MKQNVIVGILLVAVIGMAAVLFQQRQEIAELRAAAATTAVPPVKVEKKKPALAPVAEPEPEPLPEPIVAEVATEQPVPKKRAGFGGMMKKWGEMAKDPAFKDMMQAQQKMGLEFVYGSLFKSLELSTEDLNSFKDLLVERQMAQVDRGMAIMGDKKSVDEMKRSAEELKQTREQYDKQIEQFLGPEDYATFKDFEETQAERLQVQMFKGGLTGADVLTDQQEADLVAVLYQARKAEPANSIYDQTKMPDPTKFSREHIDDTLRQLEQMQEQYTKAAATVLTATQLEAFKRSQEQQLAMQKMGLKMATEMFGDDVSPTNHP